MSLCYNVGALTKGVQNGGDEVDVFVRGTMNSFFFVTGQIGMKCGETSIGPTKGQRCAHFESTVWCDLPFPL